MTHPNENAETTFAEAFESSMNFNQPQQGDLLKGTIITISGDDAFVAFGGPTEAIIHKDELQEEGFDVGDTIEASVIQTSPDLRISRKVLAKLATIHSLKQALENDLPVEGKITGRNKGGFDVKINTLRAFCPLSQIGLGRIEDPDQYVGNTYTFRILELSEDGRKFVVSRAALMKEEAAARGRELRENLQVGMTVTGVVRNVVPFGAFVDIGGLEGLLHVSEMSHRRIDNPKDFINVGDEIKVVVIKMEDDGKRISLSAKELEADPWSDIADRYPVGSSVEGKIARKTDFGLFVEIEPGVDGLVHQSQLPAGTDIGDASLKAGESMQVWVKEVDQERRRISLAMREVRTDDPWEFVLTKYPTGRVVDGTVERAVDFGVFVEVEPELTGLIPISELDLAPDQHPSSAFHSGDKISVRVMSVDAERKRMSLTTSTEDASDDAERRGSTVPPAETKSAMALALERALGGKSEE
jgi:small subunit ribosomal protein S1